MTTDSHARRAALPTDLDPHADVVVVGAGITGLSTAIMLLDAGRSVTVIEQDVPGALASGRNTGKASLLQGARLSTIRRNHPARLVRAYVDANRAGQQWLRRACERADVPFRTTTAYSYAQTADGLVSVAAEADAAREAGLPVRRPAEPDEDVPFPFAGAVALDGQLALHPPELMRGLAALVEAAGGRLVSGVRALGVRASDPVVVRTSAGEFTANQVVIATGAPMLDRGLYWAKTSGFRSMLAAFDLPAGGQDGPDGLYLSVDDPSRSIRTHRHADGSHLIVGGGDHRTGREDATDVLRAELVGWARAWWPDLDAPEVWAAQDYESHNTVPFVGRMPRGRGRVWFATGYAKWGLTNGTAAGIRIAHEILGARRPDWARIIGSRMTVPADLVRGAVEGARVGAAAVQGWVGALRAPEPGARVPDGAAARSAAPAAAAVAGVPAATVGAGASAGALPGSVVPDAATPPEGVGVVMRRGLRPTGVSTVGGETCAVSAVCPHLGGILNWNDAEATWDCPLHASRFDHRGRRIEGPAVSDLARLD
ncbi:FAD-dependent oxidoreductase [Agromyces sp. GXS1127]|uniref:FAD-dependent oxidoreductase n=1 Tax=Agromyces sp. GXS1127 TaxID=3424181 RepID=UPI003D318A4E